MLFILQLVFSDLQSITNVQTVSSADTNSIHVQWMHDVTRDPCSSFVDYVVEYALTYQDNCYQPPNSPVMRSNTSYTEYTLTGLRPFSTYIISVSARRRETKDEITMGTVSQTTRQLGMHQRLLKLIKVIL